MYGKSRQPAWESRMYSVTVVRFCLLGVPLIRRMEQYYMLDYGRNIGILRDKSMDLSDHDKSESARASSFEILVRNRGLAHRRESPEA